MYSCLYTVFESDPVTYSKKIYWFVRIVSVRRASLKGTGKKVRKTSINFIASPTSTHFMTRYPFISCFYLRTCTITHFDWKDLKSLLLYLLFVSTTNVETRTQNLLGDLGVPRARYICNSSFKICLESRRINSHKQRQRRYACHSNNCAQMLPHE